MNDQIKNGILQSQTAGQFGGVSNTSYHKHNDIDSPAIPVVNLGILAGVVQLSSGRATIKNRIITTNSVIIALSQTSHPSGSGQDTLAGVCNSGNAVLFEGSGTSADVIEYIIIVKP